YRHQYRLHVALKSAVVSGPMTSTATTVSSVYRTDPAQFDSATGYYGPYSPSFAGRVSSSYLNLPSVFARIGVIFGNLLYVPHLGVSTSVNTSGKAVNMTNILSSHIDCVTQFADKTAVYSIDLD